MKAVGFFFAVFLSMLTVFLVATGEVRRWFTPREELSGLLPPRSVENTSGDNTLEFEFWDVEEGRRRFIIRAQLSQETLHTTDSLDTLDEFSLEDGQIEMPLSRDEEGGGREKLVLRFDKAVYHKGGGLTGDAPFRVLLENGRGVLDDGTEFRFERLVFRQDAEDKGRFAIDSDQPVRIVRPPLLEVWSPSGLHGSLTDRDGFDAMAFEPPVVTYLDPAGVERLATAGDAVSGDAVSGSPGGNGASPSAGETTGRRLAVTCEGPLRLDFHRPPIASTEGAAGGEESPRDRLLISFRRGVSIFEPTGTPPEGELPQAGGNRFDCERLQIEVVGRGRRLIPVRAVARPAEDDGRVEGHWTRGQDRYVLQGKRLDWRNLDAERLVAAARGEASPPEVIRTEAVLTGDPVLRGQDLVVRSRRAVLRPDENRVHLHRVEGRFRNPKAPGDGEASPPEGARRSTNGDAGDSGRPSFDELAAPSPEGRRGAGASFEELDFVSDRAEITFRPMEEGTRHRALSTLVASSVRPRGVVVRGRDMGERDEPSFRAECERLVYRERDRRITLEGPDEELPRIAFGPSFVRGRRIHLFLEGGYARCEGRVLGVLEPEDTAAASRGEGGDRPASGEDEGPAAHLPGRVEIRAAFLEVERVEGRVHAATARSPAEEPVEVTVELDGASNTQYRFLAPEVRLDGEQEVVRLVGGEGDDGGLCRMEFEGGEIRAGRMAFDRRTWRSALRDGVDVRLYPSSGDRRERRQILADEADLVFHESFRAPKRSGEKDGPLAQLDLVRRLRGVGGSSRPLRVKAQGLVLEGEEAVWDSSSGELRFAGRGPQRIQIDRDELQGPLEAREVVYDREEQRLTLRGEVAGRLRQPPRAERGADGGARAGRGPPLAWEFETSVLEVDLGPSGDTGGRLGLDAVRARDKVLLRNRENGLKLLGDQLVYDHAARRVRVFSSEGRPQTLIHDRAHGEAAEAAREAAPGASGRDALDRILAREIRVLLVEDATPGERRSAERFVLAEFEDDVIATFSVQEPVGGRERAPEFWRLETRWLAFQLDPSADSSSPQVLPRAVARGGVVATSARFRAEGERAEYRESDRSLLLEGSPASLTHLERGETFRRPAILVRKQGEVIEIEDPAQRRRSSGPAVGAR